MRGGAREGAGRKSKGATAQINCRIKAEAKEKLLDIARQKEQTITAILEDMIMREV